MNLPRIRTQTNLVLLLSDNSETADRRKFIVWKGEDEGNLQEVLPGLYITRIAVDNSKKIFEHPLEDGSTIADYEILEPLKVSIRSYISNDDEETLSQLEDLYNNGTPLTLRAENRIIRNIAIAAQPVEIKGSVIDKTLYNITFKEAQTVTPQYVSMPQAKNKKNTSRVNSGTKKPVEEKKEAERSWLHSLFFGKKGK